MALQMADIPDAVLAALEELDKSHYVDLSYDLQDYVFAREIMQKERTTEDTGRSILLRQMRTHAQNTRGVGIESTDQTDRTDVLTTGSVPWRHIETSWRLPNKLVDLAGGAAQLVDLVEVELHGARVDFADYVESQGWRMPAGSGDNLSLWGIDYWLHWADESGNTSGTDDYDDYNDGIWSDELPDGFSDVGGIDPTTEANKRWRPWNFKYAAVTQNDLIHKIKKACYKTGFKPVPMTKDNSGLPAVRRGIYTTYTVKDELGNLARAQNENLGSDLAAMSEAAIVKQITVTAVPYLDQNTLANSDPLYGIDWGTLRMVFKKGRYMKRTGPRMDPLSHDATVTHEDSTCNIVCRNRRRNFVAAKSAIY